MTGVFVPAGTPKAIVDLLQREISAIVNAPDIKARLLELGVEAEGNSSGRVRGLRQGRNRQVEEGDRRRQDQQDLNGSRGPEYHAHRRYSRDRDPAALAATQFRTSIFPR